MNVRRTLIVVALLAAAAQLTVPAGKIDYAAGKITLAVAYPAGTSRVDLTAAGQPLQSIPIADPLTAGTCSSNPVALKVETTFTAQGFDASDGVVWGPIAVGISPAGLRPTVPKLAISRGSLIGSPFALACTTGHRATRYLIRASGFDDSVLRGTCSTAASGRVVLSGLRLPYGPEAVRVWLANGFGISSSDARVSLFNLGAKSRLPKTARFVLVDKRSMYLYYVSTGRVLRYYPVAVGTPWTPTPNGYFKLGPAKPASGPWGVLRRRLYRFSGSHLTATSFYIHGTNEPWSIGTEASHGCVRMFNAHIRLVARYVPVWVVVLIR